MEKSQFFQRPPEFHRPAMSLEGGMSYQPFTSKLIVPRNSLRRARISVSQEIVPNPGERCSSREPWLSCRWVTKSFRPITGTQRAGSTPSHQAWPESRQYPTASESAPSTTSGNFPQVLMP